MTNPAISLTDPKYIGPGVWYNIHLKAYEATDNDKIEDFIDEMYLLAQKFPCKKCRTHINAYIESHPFDDLRHLKNKEGRLIGMFKWSWLFHNAVNTRLHKPIVDWETAWEMYDVEPEVCSKNCDNEDNHEKDQIQELPTNNSNDKRSKLVQGYFMKVGIPSVLNKNGIKPEAIKELNDDITNGASKGNYEYMVSYAGN